MICPNCGFDKWDGYSTHVFGGRESAGVNCWGMKRRSVVAQPAQAPAAQRSETTKPEEHGDDLKGPPVPIKSIVHESEPPPSKRSARLSNALATLERDLGLKRAADIPQPDPSTSPKAARVQRQTKRLRRRADPARRTQKPQP